MKSKKALKSIMDTSKQYVKHNSSTILAIVSSAGVFITALSTAKATIKAIEIINELECEKKDKLTKKEIVLSTAHVYIPAILFGVSTIGCIFSLNMVNRQQQISLISAYSLINNSFKDYKEKLKELYGEETHQKIIDEIYMDKIEKTEEIYLYGECLSCVCESLYTDDNEIKIFMDAYSGRFFESTMERVLSAEYHLNRNYILRGDASLNEFYSFLGLATEDYGDVEGWTQSDEIYWIDFNHRKLISREGTEFYTIEMIFKPRIGYDEY